MIKSIKKIFKIILARSGQIWPESGRNLAQTGLTGHFLKFHFEILKNIILTFLNISLRILKFSLNIPKISYLFLIIIFCLKKIFISLKFLAGFSQIR
jgi:hypothetical protein